MDHHLTPSSSEVDGIQSISPPPELKTVFLGGLFFLAFLTAIHVASEIVMPVVLAFILKLVLQPGMRFLERLHLPRTVAALILLFMLLSAVFGFGSALSAPAVSWAEKLPEGLPKLQERLGFLSKSIESTQKLIGRAEDLTHGKGAKVMPVEIQGERLSDRLLAGTRAMIGTMFTTVFVLFFLLISGDTFLRRLVEVLPRFKDKRQAVDISQHIEHDISVYLLTITVMNAIVGIGTGLIMLVCGIDDPVLWGAVAFLLNYVPLVGPLMGAAIFFLAALLATPSLTAALLPVALYLLLHFIEGTLITPLLVARRFTLNPVLIILGLVFWYWMWGLPGMILAMPMLAITKIICDRIKALQAFGHFLEG